jgi:hypothetical protein
MGRRREKRVRGDQGSRSRVRGRVRQGSGVVSVFLFSAGEREPMYTFFYMHFRDLKVGKKDRKNMYPSLTAIYFCVSKYILWSHAYDCGLQRSS